MCSKVSHFCTDYSTSGHCNHLRLDSAHFEGKYKIIKNAYFCNMTFDKSSFWLDIVKITSQFLLVVGLAADA